MGIGDNKFISDKTEYETPNSLFQPLKEEFNIELDVCANENNTKCEKFFSKEDDAFTKVWIGNCWMNPPFGKNMRKWAIKAWEESKKYGGTKVCLLPVRANTKWWNKVIMDAEIRFIIGEVNFNNQERGLWLPMCIVIFGENAKAGTFSTILYKKTQTER